MDDQSQRKSNLDNSEELSMDNPLNGYIIFDKSNSSKEQLLTQNSKDVTLNPMFQTKYLNSEEATHQFNEHTTNITDAMQLS